jgi:endonuclease III
LSRLESIVDALQQFYGALPSPPHDPFGLFVWEVLSVHAIPRKRDAAFGALRRMRALTPDAVSRAPKKKLEDAVALAGSYTDQRLHALQTGAERFRRSPALSQMIRGPVAKARRALKTLPQMNEGGSYRMLLFGADRAVMPVDTSISRVVRRLELGVGQSASARAIRVALTAELVDEIEAFRRTFLYLSHHASATCTETGPHCTICPLSPDCPHRQRQLRTAD